jgi:hypothetical protein
MTEHKIRSDLLKLRGNGTQAATRSEVADLGSAVLDLAEEVTRLRSELDELKAHGSEEF